MAKFMPKFESLPTDPNNLPKKIWTIEASMVYPRDWTHWKPCLCLHVLKCPKGKKPRYQPYVYSQAQDKARQKLEQAQGIPGFEHFMLELIGVHESRDKMSESITDEKLHAIRDALKMHQAISQAAIFPTYHKVGVTKNYASIYADELLTEFVRIF